MHDDVLVHTADIEYLGDCYQVMIFCRNDGRHFAKTFFAKDDIIISDGISMEDTLAKHERLLPLAISSRKMLQGARRYPKRSRAFRY